MKMSTYFQSSSSWTSLDRDPSVFSIYGLQWALQVYSSWLCVDRHELTMTNMVISEMNVWEWQVGPHAVTMIAVHAASHNEARAARQHTLEAVFPSRAIVLFERNFDNLYDMETEWNVYLINRNISLMWKKVRPCAKLFLPTGKCLTRKGNDRQLQVRRFWSAGTLRRVNW